MAAIRSEEGVVLGTRLLAGSTERRRLHLGALSTLVFAAREIGSILIRESGALTGLPNGLRVIMTLCGCVLISNIFTGAGLQQLPCCPRCGVHPRWPLRLWSAVAQVQGAHQPNIDKAGQSRVRELNLKQSQALGSQRSRPIGGTPHRQSPVVGALRMNWRTAGRWHWQRREHHHITGRLTQQHNSFFSFRA
jgi:hypothetical protein